MNKTIFCWQQISKTTIKHIHLLILSLGNKMGSTTKQKTHISMALSENSRVDLMVDNG